MECIYKSILGLFNVCNKIAVTLDILLEIWRMFKTGSPVTNIIEGKIDFLLQKTDEVMHH